MPLSFTGEEFRALFLSTIEPTDTTGNTTNPTKSPCNPYVFNTVLTRSKSLVVAVGSPLFLLKIEDHMKHVYGSRAECWSNFLRVCLRNGTFIIPRYVKSEDINALEFKSSLEARLFGSEAASKSVDSITSDFNHRRTSQAVEKVSMVQHSRKPSRMDSKNTSALQSSPVMQQRAAGKSATSMQQVVKSDVSQEPKDVATFKLTSSIKDNNRRSKDKDAGK